MKLIFAVLPTLLLGPLFLKKNSGLDCNNMKHQEIYDGPYVSYKGDWIYVDYIMDNHGNYQPKTDSFPLRDKASVKLSVGTKNTGGSFPVYIKEFMENERAEYTNVSKQFAISDIEVNFNALRNMLLAGAVIDSAYNWTFGDGHLVLTGDFVDRGENVTEVLWLIYSLENKAEKAGGHVHFILGNHEIMNLSVDIRYVHNKYLCTANLLGKHFMYLFDENTELGRWLRKKNIIEKVGDVLYIHAGISPEMNKLGLAIPTINNMARPYYADSTYLFPDTRLDTIMADLGPFWYRGYYKGLPLASPQTIDSSFSLFGVKQIVTGHTVVGEKVSTWFDGKVINTDVPHAAGKSEALFIEGGKYYRVKSNGKKELL